MTDSARFALHRPEYGEALLRGEDKIIALMKGSARESPAGQILIEANTDHTYVYRLVSGWACRIRTLLDARDQCILVFLPGDLFAVKSMFVKRHFDDVVILSDAVVERIHYRDLHRAFQVDPDVATRCIWQVVEEERRLHSWVAGLGLGSADERLALLLIDFRGRLALSRTIPADTLCYEMPLTQIQLADHLGITAVHVNRVLKTFREGGIASVRDGFVTILDLERLTRIAFPLLDPYERATPEYVGPIPERPRELGRVISEPRSAAAGPPVLARPPRPR
jgi:CRP-like cAMP-binding protein